MCTVESESDDEPLGQQTSSIRFPRRPATSEVLVFQIIHSFPSRLKRPLQQDDAICSNDMAFRFYDIVETRRVEQNGAVTEFVIVQRQQNLTDIGCADFLGDGDVDLIHQTMVKLPFHGKEMRCTKAELQPLVDAGAFPSETGSTYYDLGDESAMLRLSKDGLVRKISELGSWVLTPKAVELFIEVSLVLVLSNTPIFKCIRDVPLESCTHLELTLHLTESGWEELSIVSNERLARRSPHSPGQVPYDRMIVLVFVHMYIFAFCH